MQAIFLAAAAVATANKYQMQNLILGRSIQFCSFYSDFHCFYYSKDGQNYT
jgi:hypothetical protein